MSKIQIKSVFNGWKDISETQAVEYAKWKINNITMGPNDKERLVMINNRFKGIKFSLNDLK